MGINKFFDGIAKVVERFAEDLAEQRLQEKRLGPDEVRKRNLRIQRKFLQENRFFTPISRKMG
jgi:hypothetical protein